MAQDKYITVEITKTVPVADYETLEAYLNISLEKWATSGHDEKTRAGTKALEMIKETGFTLLPPEVKRSTSGQPGYEIFSGVKS